VNSELFPDYEFDMAIDLANEMGARVIGLEMEELSDPRIAANTPKIWYYSKKLMYQTIKEHVEQEGFTVLSDGTIMDDVDDFRPGVKARNEEGVRSLLQEAGLYKSEIRQLAKRLGVENWNKVPSCSMASRFPYGTKITAEKARNHPQIEIRTETVVLEAIGDGILEAIKLKNVATGEEYVVEADEEDGTMGLFFFIGYVPQTKLFEGKVELTEGGYVKAGEDTKTSVEGVYVAGDCRQKEIRQVVTAVCDGAVAAITAEKYIAEKFE